MYVIEVFADPTAQNIYSRPQHYYIHKDKFRFFQPVSEFAFKTDMTAKSAMSRYMDTLRRDSREYGLWTYKTQVVKI